MRASLLLTFFFGFLDRVDEVDGTLRGCTGAPAAALSFFPRRGEIRVGAFFFFSPSVFRGFGETAASSATLSTTLRLLLVVGSRVSDFSETLGAPCNLFFARVAILFALTLYGRVGTSRSHDHQKIPRRLVSNAGIKSTHYCQNVAPLANRRVEKVFPEESHGRIDQNAFDTSVKQFYAFPLEI